MENVEAVGSQDATNGLSTPEFLCHACAHASWHHRATQSVLSSLCTWKLTIFGNIALVLTHVKDLKAFHGELKARLPIRKTTEVSDGEKTERFHETKLIGIMVTPRAHHMTIDTSHLLFIEF